jgi:hypothetical protein
LQGDGLIEVLHQVQKLYGYLPKPALLQVARALRLPLSRVYGVATRELGRALVGHANLGWLRTGRNKIDSTTWSLGIEGDGPIGWAADVFGDDRSRPWLSAGVKLPLGETISTNLSYAQQFSSPRVHLWTLGIKVEFK